MNEMILKFPARSENEIFARNAVAAFALPLNPSLSELSDVKTAVSEAVTNCVVHGYRGRDGWITVVDEGRGIHDLERALQPFFTTLPGEERSGMGFTIMQTFMTDFSVESEEGSGTKVRMSKDFGQKAERNAG